MTVRHHLIIIKEIAENYKIKELVLESMKKNKSINSFCVEATSSIFLSVEVMAEVSLATIPTAVKLLI